MTTTPTIEPRATGSMRGRIVRAIATIALYALAGPLFGAGFILAIWDWPALPRLVEGVGLAFAAAPFIGLFAYPGGILPALMTGSLAALLSPVTASSLKYIAHSVTIGTVTTALLLALFGVGGERFYKIAAAGAFAALCCALISTLFRCRPGPVAF